MVTITKTKAPRQPQESTTSDQAENTDFDFMNLKEAAEALRVAKISMYRLVEKRAIRFYRICNKILFKRQDLMKFIEERGTDRIAKNFYDSQKNPG